MKKFLLLTVLMAVAYPPLTTSEVISSQLDVTTPKAEKKNTVLYQRILEKNASFSDVIHSLSIDDKQALSNNINALKRYSTDMRVVALLKNIWNGDVSGHPGLAWKLLRSPSVKVSIAFVLHDADSVNARIYMEYIKKQLQSGDVEAESNAAMSLGLIGSNEDIPALEKLIINGGIVVAGSAASALGVLGTPKSRAALEKMVNSDDLGQQKKKVIQQVLHSQIWGANRYP